MSLVKSRRMRRVGVVVRGFEKQVRQPGIMPLLRANETAYQGWLLWLTRVTS